MLKIQMPLQRIRTTAHMIVAATTTVLAVTIARIVIVVVIGMGLVVSWSVIELGAIAVMMSRTTISMISLNISG